VGEERQAVPSHLTWKEVLMARVLNAWPMFIFVVFIIKYNKIVIA
jgi:hypothetical protein